MPPTDRHPDHGSVLETIERRAGRIWLRRRLAAASAVIAAVAIVAVPVTALGGGDRQTIEAAGDPTASSTEEPGTSAVEPAPTTTTSTTSSTVPPDSAPPPQPLTAEGSSGELTASATVDDAQAHTGQVLTFDLDAHDENAAWVGFGVDFGDGNGRSMAVPNVACPDEGAEDPPSDEPVDDDTVEHAYAFAGTYEVVVTVRSGGCSSPEEAVELRLEIEVEGPDAARWTATSGGLDVELLASTDEPAAGETVTFRIRATDSDGLLTEFAWKPGDGQSGFGRTSGTECESHGGELDLYTDFTEYVDHAYAEPGTYEAVVTVTTSTCDDPSERVEIRAPIKVG